MKDTIKHEGRSRDSITRTLDRTGLWAVQTPQGFQVSICCMKAHRKARDDGFRTGRTRPRWSNVLGIRVRIVEGDYRNVKITTRDDLVAARSFRKGR